MFQSRLRILAEIAIFAAIALILDRLPLYTLPQGGSISLVMLPILLLALRHGFATGLVTGAIVGSIQLFYGGYFLNIFQIFLDYAVAYAGVGFAGLFATSLKQENTGSKAVLIMTLASLVGGLFRFLGNFLSGVIFYGDYAPKGIPVWLYSLQYNMSYILPSTIICLILLVILFKARPSFFKV
ncbi:energy-coupled thiamine transporter ThiT [Streptococcus sp. X16XC17]|uniref:energy-coupled thiamine transporter ThiT n=1 Tax=unclassified Streptococcus TaxID=2608887 RepID=UPI00066FFA20|nr:MULTISPECIES: energy-coupled thiamine transporter ThiT [unclassified Streptococcus]TCD46711.1 energy-coupled thiamine transporter ThiT [Streptococcus sp. X16XC17]